MVEFRVSMESRRFINERKTNFCREKAMYGKKPGSWVGGAGELS